MEFLIDHPSFEGKHSKEEIQKLINENKISLNTKIWQSEWNEWRKIRDTDFDFTKAKFETKSGLPENIFLSIFPYLNSIDSGRLFKKPFSWIYALVGILNLIIPIYIFYKAIDNDIFESPAKLVIVFLLVWLIITFASWVSFQLWWDRKTKLTETSAEGDDFVATPVFSHLIQTLGEWIGTWVGIVGFSVALLTSIFLGDEASVLSRQIGLPFLKTGFLLIVLMPIYGFLIILSTRFISEQFRALSSIANNTRKS